MRNFNEFEKKILKTLHNDVDPNIKTRSLSAFIEEQFLKDRAIILDRDIKRLLVFHKSRNDINILEELLTFASLIKYLNSERLVVLLEHDINKEQSFYSESLKCEYIKKERKIYNKYDSEKKEIQLEWGIALHGYHDYIDSILHCDIMLTSELMELIENNFVTHEQQIFNLAKEQTFLSKKQTKISYLVILFSFISLLGSGYMSYKSNQHQIVKLDKSQSDYFLKPMKDIIDRLDSIDLKMQKTLKNSIIEPHTMTAPAEKKIKISTPKPN